MDAGVAIILIIVLGVVASQRSKEDSKEESSSVVCILSKCEFIIEESEYEDITPNGDSTLRLRSFGSTGTPR